MRAAGHAGVGNAAERLPRVDVRQMDLGRRQADGLERVEQGDGRVRIGGGIDDEAVKHAVGVDCGFLTAPVADPLVFHLLYKDPMNVLLPERHPLTRQNVLTLPEIKKEPLVLPTKGSDNDIQAVLNSTRGKTNVRYVLNDDLSVISMVSHGFGITIMPELILRNLNYSLEIRPIDPPQYRAIGIASMPLNRVSVLTKTFIQYLTDPSKIDFNELCS